MYITSSYLSPTARFDAPALTLGQPPAFSGNWFSFDPAKGEKDIFKEGLNGIPNALSNFKQNTLDFIGRYPKRILFGLTAIGLPLIGYQISKPDSAPVVSQIEYANGDLCECEMTKNLVVNCNGFERGEVKAGGRVTNTLWGVGRVYSDGRSPATYNMEFQNGLMDYPVQVGTVRNDSIFQPTGDFVGTIQTNTDWLGVDVTEEQRAGYALLAGRGDANDDVWYTALKILEAAAEAAAEESANDE